LEKENVQPENKTTAAKLAQISALVKTFVEIGGLRKLVGVAFCYQIIKDPVEQPKENDSQNNNGTRQDRYTYGTGKPGKTISDFLFEV
jgi:hypothetical protein